MAISKRQMRIWVGSSGEKSEVEMKIRESASDIAQNEERRPWAEL